MRGYLFLLFSIGYLYWICWSYNHQRQGTVLVEINKKLASILGFITVKNKSSILSIILGLYTHISLMMLVILAVYAAITSQNINIGLIGINWWLISTSVCGVGLEVETVIKIKKTKLIREKIGLYSMAFFFLFSVAYLLGMVVENIRNFI